MFLKYPILADGSFTTSATWETLRAYVQTIKTNVRLHMMNPKVRKLLEIFNLN